MADIASLKNSFRVNGRRAAISAWVIVAGLAIDIIVLLAFSAEKSWIETSCAIFATVVIATGVGFEIHFDHKAGDAAQELQQISDEKVAEANARAAEANRKALEAQLELARFRSSRRNDIKGKTGNLIERLRLFAGTEFDSGRGTDSGEQADFWWDLQPVLIEAGWINLPWDFPEMTGGISLSQGPTRPVCGAVAAENVEIHLHHQNREKLLPAASALISALNEAGIAATDAGYNTHSANEAAIHILIGDKR